MNKILENKLKNKIESIVHGKKNAIVTINWHIKKKDVTLEEVIQLFYDFGYSKYIHELWRTDTEMQDFFLNIIANTNEIIKIVTKIKDYEFITDFIRYIIPNEKFLKKTNNEIEIDTIISLLTYWINESKESNDAKVGLIRNRLAKYVNKENFDDAFKKIFDTENGVLISGFMQAYKFDLNLELDNNPFTDDNDTLNKIIDSKNAELIFEYAFSLKVTRSLDSKLINKLAMAIIETRDAHYIYKFAIDIPFAPELDLAKTIIELKDFKHMCLLIQNKVCEKQVFLEIIKLLGIQNNSIEEIETALKYLAQAGNFSELSVDIFIIYYKKLLENKNPQNEITTPQELFNSTKRKLMARESNVKANNSNSSK